MAAWPLDLARGVRQALGNPGVGAIRDLLTATIAPDEVGALFTVAESDVRLVAAAPRADPFDLPSVQRLARDACRGTEPVEAVASAEWPAAVALPLGEGEIARVLVLLGQAPGGVSAETRARAALVAPILGLVADLDGVRGRARQAEAQVADFRQMLRLAKPGRDLEEISQEVLGLAVRLIDADLGALWLRGRPGADLELRAARRGLERRGPRPALAAADVEPLLGAAPLACPPYPLVLPRALLRDESVQAAVLIPLHHDDELVGLLAAGRHEAARSFGPREAERLSELAELAAVPVVNVCLRQELRERTRQGRATRRIAKVTAESLPLEELFRVATRELRRLTAFDASALVVLDETGDGGRVLVGEPGAAPRILSWTPELREGLPGTVIRARRAVIGSELAAGRSVGPLGREWPETRAAIGVPLLADGESLGALLLLSRARGRFGAAELRRVRPAAGQLALALRQARLSRTLTAGREERRRLEARLGRAERLATIGRLTGALAHEIRNPLTVIGTTVQYLRDRLPADHEHRAMLDSADRKVREMDESLEGLLSLSRPLDLRPRAVDVPGLLASLAGVVRARAGRQSVDVTVAAAPGLPAATWDPRLVEQALLSLALNALDAMPDGGRLAFAARLAPESGNVVLTVSDTGPGIQDTDLGGIFEPYYATKRRGGGLGLALARRIVEEHGGAIEATSEPGRGTTFVIVLPPGGAIREPGDG